MRAILPTMAVVGVVSFLLSAHAAGPFDGTWTFDAQAVGGGSSESAGQAACAAQRFQISISDNQVMGSLQQSYYGRGVTQGQGRSAAPVTGSVQPDGTLSVKWQKFSATGKLAGDKGQIKWRSQCGPRVATGARAAG